jgi:signal transduction histidine kinase
LEMVMLNLLTNAIEALDNKNGSRNIRIHSSQTEGKIRLSVEDSGAGVPNESMEKIFDLFRTTKNDGMGVGLWLSRAVMDNHRGSLTLDSDYTNGARFTVQFNSDELVF